MISKKRTYIHISAMLVFLLSMRLGATPKQVTIDVSSLMGQAFELEVSLYDNSGVIGDTWVLLDDIVYGSQGEDFEDGTTGAFDDSLNPDSVNATEGNLLGDGDYVLRIDEDPGVTPTITFMDFTLSDAGLLSFTFDMVASTTAGPFGYDELVFCIVDPVTLQPLVPGLTIDFGDVLAADYEGITSAEQHTLSIGSTDGGSVVTPGEGDFDYIQYDNPVYTIVPIAAVAEPCHHFVEWTGTAVAAGKVADVTSPTTTVSVDADYTLQAVFAINEYSVSLSVSAGGRIVQPGGGDFIYDCGTDLLLKAEATDPLFEFAGWTGSLFRPTDRTVLKIKHDHHIRATFLSVLETIYVDDAAAGDPSPFDNTESDPAENGTAEHPFDSIQEAIEVAKTGATVVVRDGTYWECIDFMDKAITVTGFEPESAEAVCHFPVIHGNGEGPVVTFLSNDHPEATLTGFVITGGYGDRAGGIYCGGSCPTIAHCLIVGNRSTSSPSGGGAVFCRDSSPVLANCTLAGNFNRGSRGGGFSCIKSTPVLMDSILCDNQPNALYVDDQSETTVSYCNIEGGFPGQDNLDVDPAFVLCGYWANPANLSQPLEPWDPEAVWIEGDYHLQAGSPCIDAGNPTASAESEPEPNGGRINLGTYGGTDQASSS